MNLGLEGKVALVGGCSRGLGLAVARALAEEGCHLLLSARSPGPLEQAREELSGTSSGRVEAFATDLSSGEGCRRLLGRAHELYDQVDILVTNTGGPPAGRFEAHEIQAWRDATALLLESVIHLARGVLPGMRKEGWGRILAITSIAVKQPVDGLILSNTLRAGVTGFARTLANEVAADGITVNTLLPGYTRTERLQDLEEHHARERGIRPEEVRAGWESEIPAGRLGEPKELGALAAFLASPLAGYITGQAIAVDGGWIRSLV